jgi:hypothetical protein
VFADMGMRGWIAAAVLVVAAGACTDQAAEAPRGEAADRVTLEPLAQQDFSGKGVAGSASQAASARQPVTGTAPPPPMPQATRDSIRPGQMLIRNGFVNVRVDSLEAAIAAVRQLAATLGGTIGNVSMSSGEYEVRSATLELRVPSPRFDDAMGGLSPIGRVEHRTETVEDVGEEFVDLNARMATSRRLEQRLVELLATRTGRLEDVLAVERELARVRQEIERAEGRLRYLGARVATSTINVTVSERAPVTGPNPGRNVIVEAFVDAWRNFVGLVAWVIASLGVIIPLGLVGWLALRLLRGRTRRRVAD